MLAKTSQLLHSVLGGTLKRTRHSGHVWLLATAVFELVKEGETRTMGVDGVGLCAPEEGENGRQSCSSERRPNMVG